MPFIFNCYSHVQLTCTLVIFSLSTFCDKPAPKKCMSCINWMHKLLLLTKYVANPRARVSKNCLDVDYIMSACVGGSRWDISQSCGKQSILNAHKKMNHEVLSGRSQISISSSTYGEYRLKHKCKSMAEIGGCMVLQYLL